MKHIKKNCVPIFAANLKKGLRKAFGVSFPNKVDKYNQSRSTVTRPDKGINHTNPNENERVEQPMINISSPNRIPIGTRLKYIQEGINPVNKLNFKELLINKITAAIREL